ncbi:MAG: CocE/NonD family hydrolase, partial [Longimicrobiales bacterium]|nr:CocE/NonD family hydrolase [Longimicrobiales bacterium]
MMPLPHSPLRPTHAFATVAAGLVAAAAGLVATATPAQAQPAATPRPLFVDGQAQIVPAFADSTSWIREELWVEADFDSDGDGRPDRLRVAVVRPAATADGLKVPVVYESSPYFSGTASSTDFFWDVRHDPGTPPPAREPAPNVVRRARPGISNSHVDTWVPRGFAVVHSEAPGTGLSQGCPTIGGPIEVNAPRAVIDWLNGRAKGWSDPVGGEEVVAEWTTGRVGMIGTSYNGTLPVAAATTGVEGLEAIVPIAPNTSYYRYYRSNGLVRNPGGYPGEDVDMLYDFVNSGDPTRRAWCTARWRDGELIAGQDRTSGDYNEFWAERDLWNELDGVRAAVLMAHAFNDWNVMPEHSVRVASTLKARGVPVVQYYHQGGHGGAPPLELVNRWFTRWLWEVENGVEEGPGAWIVREGDPRTRPTPYPDYPHPEARPVVLHPHAAEGSAEGRLRADAGRGRDTFTDDVTHDGEALATDPAARGHRLLYTTPELVQPLHLSGTARITLRIA